MAATWFIISISKADDLYGDGCVLQSSDALTVGTQTLAIEAQGQVASQ
jgi:hypothetical protein